MVSCRINGQRLCQKLHGVAIISPDCPVPLRICVPGILNSTISAGHLPGTSSGNSTTMVQRPQARLELQRMTDLIAPSGRRYGQQRSEERIFKGGVAVADEGRTSGHLQAVRPLSGIDRNPRASLLFDGGGSCNRTPAGDDGSTTPRHRFGHCLISALPFPLSRRCCLPAEVW